MRTTKRQTDSSVIQRLIDEPYRFEFLQAVRLILGLLREHGISDDRALTQIMRFESSTRLGFPPSEIESLHGDGEMDVRTDRMLAIAVNGQSRLGIRITPAFIGFLGTCGVLPLHYSERIAAYQQRARNAGASAFMNVFSNRLIGQFYLAWQKYRLEQSVTKSGPDRQLTILLSLAGQSNASSPRNQALAFYSTLFRTRPASATVIARALTDYFDVPIHLEQFVGSWNLVPQKLRSRLGRSNQRLGFGHALGTRVWRHNRRICLHVGPISGTRLPQFLPRTSTAHGLEEMLELFDVGPIEVEVRLVIEPECIRHIELTTTNKSRQSTLGWSTFLTRDIRSVARPELRYKLGLG